MGKICVSLLLLGMLFDSFDAKVIGDGGSCCVKKTVGGVAYTLVTEGDTTKYGCEENCIYTRDDQPGGTQFCFKAGGLESVCNPDMEDQFLYLSETRILRLPSFEEVPCNQDFPEHHLEWATAGIVADNNLLVCGGRGMHTTCMMWTENGWLEKGTGFSRYSGAAASSVDGSLIITGGNDDTGNRLASTMIYTEDVGWEDFTPLPVAIYLHCQVSVGDSVYIIGGRTKHASTGATYKLSMSTKQWVRQSNLNTPRDALGCAEWDGGLLAVGGRNGPGGPGSQLSSVEKYNPVSNKWSTFTPLPIALHRMQALVWGNDLYVLGGLQGNNNEVSKKVYKLKHDEDTWNELEVEIEAFKPNDNRPVFPAVTLSTINCT